jgi:hypothetical protein
MHNFIKLSSYVINTKFISKIHLKNDCFSIYFSNHYISGYHILSFGGINSPENVIHISKEKDPIEFNIFNIWFNNIK